MSALGGTYKRTPEDFKVIEDSYKIVENPEGPFVALRIKCTKWEKLQLRSVIAKRLRIPVTRVVFAGLKDKQAVTTQVITVKASLEECESIKNLPNLEVLEMARVMNPLTIGALYGNAFSVTIRNTLVEGEDLKVSLEEKVEVIEQNGLKNYFGEQRFGRDKINISIGERLRVKDYLGALKSIIVSGYPEAFFESPNELLVALKRVFPKHLYYMYGHYLDTGDPREAIFRNLPRGLLRMYNLAYQGHLFNKKLDDPRATSYYCPLTPKGNPLLAERVKITRKNKHVFVRKLENREGVLVYRVGLRSFRPGRFYPDSLNISELSANSYTLSFRLPKGCYATEVIKAFINAPVV